jgi:TonB-dependent starch-binding outer membrane protein SusC
MSWRQLLFNPNQSKIMLFQVLRLPASARQHAGVNVFNLRVFLRQLRNGAGEKILRVMKLTAILLLAACMTVAAKSNSQVTLAEKNSPLQKVFKKIQQQTGFEFLYPSDLVEKAGAVTINLTNVSVEEAVREVLKGKRLSFVITDKTVVIKELVATNEVSEVPQIPSATDVSGKVIDEEGNPLKGATVKVRGTGIATSSDENGVFTLSGVDPNATIEISFVGYEKTTIALRNRTSITATLKKEIQSLNEVVINKGYYTEKQRLSVGNSVTITSKDIEKQPVNNPLLALTGRVPGLQIMQQNGIAGGGITVRIQGRNNLNNSLVGSDPLILIDGVPYASQNLSTFKGGSAAAPILGSSANDISYQIPSKNFGNPLAFINPTDIESITILKDAEATAIYGSRAANGAILITTKKGRVGELKMDVNLQQGWGQVPKKMKLLNSEQYMQMRHEAIRNDGRSITSSAYDLRGVWDTTRYTDWQEELIGGTAAYTRLSAGISGGSNTVQYMVGSTYSRETSVFPGNFANTSGSLHFSLSANSANRRLKMQLGGSYLTNNNKLPAEDYTTHALNLPPVAPALYNTDGSLNWAPDPLTGNSTWWNPLSKQSNLFEMKTHNLVSNGSLSYHLLPVLELKSTFGFTSTSTDQFIAALDQSEKPELRESRIRSSSFSFNSSRSWIVEPQLVWQQKWNLHSITTLLGSSFQYQNNNGRLLNSNGQTNDLLLRNLLSGTGVSGGIDVSEYKYNAIFGRISYTFQDKYLLNASIRRDGSSRFGHNSQFNNFWSVGAGWILTEEPYFKKQIPWLSFAKIRGSYGTTGNDQIGNYMFLNLYGSSVTGIPYQGIGSSNALGLPNPNLEWEETRKLQGGIDLGLIKDRFFVSVSYFQNRTSNNLTTIPLPIITGFTSITQNLPALIQNAGWEFSINTVNFNSENFRWSSNLNLTVPRNRLLEFPGLELSSLKSFMAIGQPLGSSRIYPFYGIDPLTGVPLIRNRFGEPTSNPTLEDATLFLNNEPRWYGGLQNSFSYKGFLLDFFFQFVKQYGMDVSQLAYFPGYFRSLDFSSMYGNQPVEVMNRWQRPGDLSNYPAFTMGSLLVGDQGDHFYRDISFLRLKNLSLSYQFTGDWIQKSKLKLVRLFAQGQNLLTISRYKGLDPETQSISSLPPLRVITIGLQATF